VGASEQVGDPDRFESGGEVELEIPARSEYVALVRLLVATVAATRAGLSDDRVDDLRIAVSEAVTNAIESYDRPDGRVKVVWREYPDHVEVLVCDSGRGFDPWSPAPRQHPGGEAAVERGLGIPLMKALVDEVHFSSSPQGTVAQLIVSCSSSSGAARAADLFTEGLGEGAD
jgi:serine/threonine-protein kinase RsbW